LQSARLVAAVAELGRSAAEHFPPIRTLLQSESAPLAFFAFFAIFEFFVVNPLGQNRGGLKFSAGQPNLVCGAGK
jgi:hypothetical protein